jgi:outer membrane receptor for ferrienterochelin and colicins
MKPFITLLLIVMLLFAANVFGQNQKIYGVVQDAETGEALPNANVIIQGTTLGAAADQNGEFVIPSLSSGVVTLKVSYLGYEPTLLTVDLSHPLTEPLIFKLKKSFLQMDQVVVTATRGEKLLENVPVMTEVIQRQEIDEKGAEDLGEVLEDRAGITVETESSGGTMFYMNGVDSKRILLLVDGVPIAGKVNNRNPLDLVDADKIDRVEIVKGPGSALYGTEAMGGVINVITKGFSDQFNLRFNGRAGSNDLYSGNLALSGGLKDLNYEMDVDHSTRGFNQGSAEIKINSSTTDRVNGRLGYKNSFLGRLALQGEYRQDEQDSQSSREGEIRDNVAVNKNMNTGLLWNKQAASFLEIQVNGFAAENNRTYESAIVGSAAPASLDTTTEKLAGFKSDFTVTPADNWKADFGLDFSTNDYANLRLDADHNRKQTGVFGQVETDGIKHVTLVAGARYDKITAFNGHFSPRLSGMVSFTPDLKLRASYGGGFRAPSFIELYSDFRVPAGGPPIFILGNKELKPEKSLGGNVGLEYRWNERLLTNIAVFQNKFEDMIVEYPQDHSTYSYLNARHATFQGVEFQSRFSILNNLKATLSYNYTDIVQDEDDAAISKISPHTGMVRLTYGLLHNKLEFSLRNQLFSKRQILVVSPSGDFVKENKNGYDMVDLTISYRLNSQFVFRLGGLNLTNYTDENYGPYLGRQMFIGIGAEL